MSRFIGRHPIAVFLAWFFTVGQALAFTPLVIGDAIGPAQLFICASTLVGLLLPALVITRVVDGPGAVRALLAKAVALRAGIGWYLLALLGVPLVAAAVTALLAGPPSQFSDGVLVPHLLLPLVLTLLPNNLWEEVAWMGFVQARLQDRRGPAVAALLTGPLFALQHVSGAVENGPVGAAVLLVVLTVLVIPFRFLTGWIYNRTGSLFLVGLVHGMGNAVAGGSGFDTGLLAFLYPGQPLATMAHLLTFFVIGLVVLVATRGRLGFRTSDPAPPEPASPQPVRP
jgi:membrane protease YdiL (CAAX protease family)